MVQLRELSAISLQRFYRKDVVLHRIMRNIVELKRRRAAELVIKKFIDKKVLLARYRNKMATLIQLFLRSKMFKVRMKRIIKTTKMAITTNMTRLYDSVLKVLDDKMNYINDLLKEAIPEEALAKVSRIISKKEKEDSDSKRGDTAAASTATDINIFYNYMKKIRYEAKLVQQRMLLTEHTVDNIKMAINSSFRIALLYDKIADEYGELGHNENSIKINKNKRMSKGKTKTNALSSSATTASKATLIKLKRNSSVKRRGSNIRRNSDAKSIADSINSDLSDEFNLTLTHTESAVFSDGSSTDSDGSIAMSRQGSTSSISKSSSKRRISGVGGVIALNESNLSSLNLLHNRASSRRLLQKSSSKMSYKKKAKKTASKKEKGPRYTFANLEEFHDDTLDLYVKAVKNGKNITKESLLSKVSNLAKNASAFYKAVEENDTVGFRETLIVARDMNNEVAVSRNVGIDKVSSTSTSLDTESLLTHLMGVKYKLQPDDPVLKNLMWYASIKASTNTNTNEISFLKSNRMKSINGGTFASMQLVNSLDNSAAGIARPTIDSATYPIILCKQLLWSVYAPYSEFEALVTGSRNMIRSAEWLLGLISETIKCVCTELMSARLLPPLPSMASYSSCVVSPIGFTISLNKPMSYTELTIYKCLAVGIASPYQKINKNEINYRDGITPMLSYVSNLVQSMRRMSDGSVLNTSTDTGTALIDSVELSVVGATNIDPGRYIIQAIGVLKGSKSCKDTVFDLIACINKLRVNSTANSRSTGAITLLSLVSDNGRLLLFSCYVLALVTHFNNSNNNQTATPNPYEIGIIPVQISLVTAINCLQYLVEGRPAPSWRSVNEVIHGIIVRYQSKSTDTAVRENELLIQCVTRVFDLVGFDIKAFSNQKTEDVASGDPATIESTDAPSTDRLIPHPPSNEQPSSKVSDISPRVLKSVSTIDDPQLSVANRHDVIESTNIVVDSELPMPENMTMFEYQNMLKKKQDEIYKTKFIEDTFDFSILNRSISPYDLVLVLLDHHVKQIEEVKFAIKANEYFVKADVSQIGKISRKQFVGFINSIAVDEISNNEITEHYNAALSSTSTAGSSDGIQMNFVAFIEVIKLLHNKKIINM